VDVVCLFPVTTSKIERLDVRRLLPRGEEEQLTYEIVRFHLEDLNALAERTIGRPKGGTDFARSAARVAAIIQAARWHRAGFVGAIKRFVAEGRAEGVDAFGPALLLMALEPGRAPALLRPPAPVRALAAKFLPSADAGHQVRRGPGSKVQPAGRPK
jgi:hypothetical protein